MLIRVITIVTVAILLMMAGAVVYDFYLYETKQDTISDVVTGRYIDNEFRGVLGGLTVGMIVGTIGGLLIGHFYWPNFTESKVLSPTDLEILEDIKSPNIKKFASMLRRQHRL